MNLIRKSACAVVMLMLGAVAGCTGEDQTTTPSSPSTANVPKAPTKPVVPPAPNEAAKADPAKDMQPPPAKAVDSKKSEESPKLEPPKADSKGDSAAAKLSPDEIATIKQLPAADQELALKQAVCPISDGHLGQMGKPYKIIAEGRTVFLCCKDCEEDVKKDPKAVLAKLDAAQAAKK